MRSGSMVFPGVSPRPLYQPALPVRVTLRRRAAATQDAKTAGSGDKIGQYGIIWFIIFFLIWTGGSLYSTLAKKSLWMQKPRELWLLSHVSPVWCTALILLPVIVKQQMSLPCHARCRGGPASYRDIPASQPARMASMALPSRWALPIERTGCPACSMAWARELSSWTPEATTTQSQG